MRAIQYRLRWHVTVKNNYGLQSLHAETTALRPVRSLRVSFHRQACLCRQGTHRQELFYTLRGCQRKGSWYLSESASCLYQSHAGVARGYNLQELVPYEPMQLLLHDCLLSLYAVNI